MYQVSVRTPDRCINYEKHLVLSYDTKHRIEGVSDKEKQLRIAGSVLLVRDQVSNCFDTVSRALYAVPSRACLGSYP